MVFALKRAVDLCPHMPQSRRCRRLLGGPAASTGCSTPTHETESAARPRGCFRRSAKTSHEGGASMGPQEVAAKDDSAKLLGGPGLYHGLCPYPQGINQCSCCFTSGSSKMERLRMKLPSSLRRCPSVGGSDRHSRWGKASAGRGHPDCKITPNRLVVSLPNTAIGASEGCS